MKFFKTLFILWGISAAGNIIKAQKETELIREQDDEMSIICAEDDRLTREFDLINESHSIEDVERQIEEEDKQTDELLEMLMRREIEDAKNQV
jgi:hypothetical protein